MKNYSRLLWLGFFALLIAVAVFLVPGAARQVAAGPAVMIDHFDVSQSVTANSSTPVSSTVNGATNLIGSYRKMWAQRTSGSGDLTSNANTVAGKFQHNPDSNVRGVTRITWDGGSGLGDSLQFNLNANLSGEDAIVLALEHADRATVVFTMTLYTTNATTCSRLVKSPPSVVDSNYPPLGIVFRFTDFTTPTACTGGSASTSDVDAIVLEVDTTANDGNDIRLHLIEATKLDFGDLPTTGFGSIVILPDGGAHAYNSSLYLGSNWDAETNGQRSDNATLDDTTGTDDEDGVAAYGNDWSAGQTVSFTVKVNGDGCLSGWIDWGQDSGFDASDRVITNTAVSTGVYTYTLTVPNASQASPFVYFSRFRLFSRNGLGGCPDPATYGALPYNYQHFGGEVEDHKIGRAPTSVTLESFSGAAVPMDTAIPVVGIVGGVGILGLLALRRRRS